MDSSTVTGLAPLLVPNRVAATRAVDEQDIGHAMAGAGLVLAVGDLGVVGWGGQR